MAIPVLSSQSIARIRAAVKLIEGLPAELVGRSGRRPSSYAVTVEFDLLIQTVGKVPGAAGNRFRYGGIEVVRNGDNWIPKGGKGRVVEVNGSGITAYALNRTEASNDGEGVEAPGYDFDALSEIADVSMSHIRGGPVVRCREYKLAGVLYRDFNCENVLVGTCRQGGPGNTPTDEVPNDDPPPPPPKPDPNPNQPPPAPPPPGADLNTGDQDQTPDPDEGAGPFDPPSEPDPNRPPNNDERRPSPPPSPPPGPHGDPNPHDPPGDAKNPLFTGDGVGLPEFQQPGDDFEKFDDAIQGGRG